MFTLIRMLSWRDLAIGQVPIFLAALLVAETFYKFHSFLLETGAFLVTWYVFDAAVTLVGRGLEGRRQ
jgi:hypothetical protein